MDIPERWASTGRRLRIHLRQQPDMDTAYGPRRWANILLMWALESVYLAYGWREARVVIKEATKDFFSAKSGDVA